MKSVDERYDELVDHLIDLESYRADARAIGARVRRFETAFMFAEWAAARSLAENAARMGVIA